MIQPSKQVMEDHSEKGCFTRKSPLKLCNEKIDKVYNMELQQKDIIQSQDKKPSTSKEFHCSYCTKGFTVSKNLVRHVKVVHHNVRPFSCEDCKKAFASKQELVGHSKKRCKSGSIPKKNKEFHCKYCSKGFTERKNRVRHVKVVHQPFSCEETIFL